MPVTSHRTCRARGALESSEFALPVIAPVVVVVGRGRFRRLSELIDNFIIRSISLNISARLWWWRRLELLISSLLLLRDKSAACRMLVLLLRCHRQGKTSTFNYGIE